MRKLVAVLQVFLVSIVLVGCSGAGPRPAPQPDLACLSGDIANFFRNFTDGEADVTILEIDGVPIKPSMGTVCFNPGRHRLKISGWNNGTYGVFSQIATGYAEFEFEKGKNYRLRSNLRGISFVFRLMDSSTSPEVEITRLSLKANEIEQTDVLFIPIR